MANKFKSIGVDLTTTNDTTVLTATASSVLIIGSIVVSNNHASTASTLSITMDDTSAGTVVNILTLEPLTAGQSFEVLTRPIIADNLDILKVQAANANIITVLVSYIDRDRS